MEKITFTPQEGGAVEFYILEQTMIGGVNYLLVTDSAEGDGEALILCDVSAAEDAEAVYEIVEDDETLNAVAAVFEKIMDDVDIIQ
ncbi:MAG: DUF1292 domain-containing protein [Lachnospiraceae bacterium]|nr:DUF1292 domain-containing protein [Lachnospiraceae bacterium]